MSVNVYALYTRTDELCQTCGYFSLNLRRSSVAKIVDLLELRAADVVGWIGCGDGRELLQVAQDFPDVRFVGIDHNAAAIRVAQRVLAVVNLRNVRFECADALADTRRYSHVYSTAVAGPAMYRHLLDICTRRLCTLRSMWVAPVTAGLRAATVHLSGSGEQRQLVAADVAALPAPAGAAPSSRRAASVAAATRGMKKRSKSTRGRAGGRPRDAACDGGSSLRGRCRGT